MDGRSPGLPARNAGGRCRLAVSDCEGGRAPSQTKKEGRRRLKGGSSSLT